ncbi:MAG: hypothetical protein OEY97_13085 [Nitrospirota bacterium]|nr:hypothetical protein [Nitrospirota bacterium]
MGSLAAHIVSVAALSSEQAAEMCSLYAGYYEGTSAETFQADLHDKDYVLLLKDEQDRVQGFSTLAVQSFDFEGQHHRALFSGDTIIDHRHWGQQSFARAWIQFAGQIKAQERETPLYWFLICKGHRTYRYLPNFSNRFFPTWETETPAREQALMDRLARVRFGKVYDRDRGVLHFPTSRGHLRGKWVHVPEHLKSRPEVAPIV